MVVELVLSIIILLFSFIFIVDIVPLLKTWFLRIKIGRYNNLDQWAEAVTKIGVRWLNHTPKIKITDNKRLIILDILKGNYAKSTLQHWQEASLLLSLADYLKINDDQEARTSILRFLDRTFNNKGQWRNKPQYVDSAILAYAIMKIDFVNNEKYKPAFDYIWNLLQDHIGKDGTVGYRNTMKDYRYVDTIGFICPFLIGYGLRYGKGECVDLAVKQIMEYRKYGFSDSQHIPCHAYDINTQAPLGLYGWGRGLGWFAIGVIDAWGELPEQHPYKYELEKVIVEFSRAILAFQNSNGSWGWTVTRKESRLDSSTTATLTWFLLNATAIDTISTDCLRGSQQAIEYLMTVTRRDGAIEFSQGDTKDVGVYSMEFGVLPFTQGFSIRLSHLSRLNGQ